MRMSAIVPVIVLAGLASPVQALTMADPLSAWRGGTAMDRMQLATRFGKSFVTLNESFTAGYFLKCIDDISGYNNAKDAKIEDAVRECVAARLRQPGDDDE